jgi:hypothetical protein
MDKQAWTSECPTKADAGDSYYFVRRKDKTDVVIMGFSMGKGWLNGVSYESSEMRSHLFLGPITPDQFTDLSKLRQAMGWICDACDAAYNEDPNNGRIHELFNIAAKACGLTRRLPDEYVKFPE